MTARADQQRWNVDEARRSGNPDFDIRSDWIDYDSAGATGPHDLFEAVRRVLDAVLLSRDILDLGLRSSADLTRHTELAKRIVELRAALRTRLEQEGLSELVVPFEPGAYNNEATIGQNLLFGVAAVVNAVLLLLIAAFVLIEAWQRLSQPPDISPGAMLAFALVGLVANGISLFILREAQATSLNMRGAYLEVMGDLAGSVAVIVAAVVIALTGWWWADVVASVVIGLLILPRTLALLRDATNVLMESTPKGVDMDHVRRHILDAPGVVDCHDLHAWTITSGMNVVSAHVVISEDAAPSMVLDYLCGCLSDDFDIEHSTFQLETVDRRRLEERAHA